MFKRMAKILGAIAGVALAAWLFVSWDTRESPQSLAAAAPSTLALGPLPARMPLPVVAPPVELSDADHAFLRGLRSKFAPHLAQPHARIKAIEQIIAYLQQHYPDDWQTRVRTFLAALAPELVDALVAHFEGLTRLNAWLSAHREELLRLPPEERRAALWAARREAFGADAEAIYAGEARAGQLADTLKAIDVAQGLTTDEKLARYLDTVNQAWGEQAGAFLEARRTELMNSFLEMPSVQEDLRSQRPEERRDTLRRIRADMGMDEAALARWDALDQQRDEAWALSQRYERERAAILARYEGAEQTQRLAALQDELFGAEAQTIREEEAAGFFRYGRPRRIGRE